MDEVIQIIRELGFPIACVVALFWQNNHLQEQHREDLNKVTEDINKVTEAINKVTEAINKVTEAINKVTEAINNNTQATQALKDRIGGLSK